MLRIPGIYDHYDDGGKLLRRELSEKGVPAIIKTAADLSEATTKYDEDYALVTSSENGKEYRYPVSDAGNALASAIYFSHYGDSLPEDLQKEAAAKLNLALVSFGFQPPEQLTKTAAMELGYSGEAQDMSLESLFGFTGSAEDDMELVEDAFAGLSPRGKRRLALQVKQAGVDLPEYLLPYGEDGIGADLEFAIDTRRKVTSDKQDILDEFLKQAASGAYTPDVLAEGLSHFDQENNITHLYGRAVVDPYAAVFGNTVKEKSASATTETISINNVDYTTDDIVNWTNGPGEKALEDTFGADFSGQFKEDPVNVLESLPVTHKQAIARMIDGHR